MGDRDDDVIGYETVVDNACGLGVRENDVI